MPSWAWALVGLGVFDLALGFVICRAAGWGDDTIERWRNPR